MATNPNREDTETYAPPANKPKSAGKSYRTVKEMISSENLSEPTSQQFDTLASETRITANLAKARSAAGLTQQQMADALKLTQSAVSKLEAGTDAELKLHELEEYARVTGFRFGLSFGKPLNHVEAINLHIQGIRDRLSALAKIAHQDDQMEKEIQATFGQFAVKILNILAMSQQDMPNKTGIKIEFMVAKKPQSGGTQYSAPCGEGQLAQI